MQTTNIYIGTTALRLSKKIKGNKILIGNHLEDTKHNPDIIFKCIPSNCREEYSQRLNEIEELNTNYTKIIDSYSKKINLSDAKYLATANDNINIVFALGGHFTRIVVPIVINEFTNKNKQVQLLAQASGLSFQVDSENLLLEYIKHNYSSVPLKLIKFQEKIIARKASKSLEEYFNDLDALIIKNIQDATF